LTVVLTVILGAATLALSGGGCDDPPKKVENRYPTLPHKQVPAFMKGSIYEFADLGGTDPFPISAYGLVVNLNGTGGSRAPTAVREYMIKEMARHGFGTVGGGLGSPEELLANKSFAIVRVDGFLPPGARAGSDWWTWFDVHVTALPESDVTSLAHGDLYLTDLKVAGANPLDPGSGNVQVWAQAKGPIFINPAYALDDKTATVAARNSRRNGWVIGGARPLDNRPLFLRLRAPERRMARAIERRINEQFQDVLDKDLPIKGTNPFLAEAEDEGVIKVYVPRAYSDDWVHFAGLLKHTYINGSPEFAAIESRRLADEAVKPDAKLLDITFAWETLGKPALAAIEPLMSHPNPDVQYAAARAAALIGDPSAVSTLMMIARTTGNPFRANAVQTLGALPQTPLVDKLLAQLLGSDLAPVRIEAYRVLAKHRDSIIYSRVVKRGDNEKFILDIVPGGGTPMVYASRQGIPRLAVFGVQTSLDLPVTFASLNDRLTVTSLGDSDQVTIFYRGEELKKPVKIVCGPSVAELVSRLGGEGAPGDPSLDFSYADVVAITQALIDQQKVSGLCSGQRQLAGFVLQEPPRAEETIDSRPLLRDSGGRPQTPPTTAGAQPVAGPERPSQVGSTAMESSNGK
jgi:flagellar basal body P-ring protein FlgI